MAMRADRGYDFNRTLIVPVPSLMIGAETAAKRSIASRSRTMANTLKRGGTPNYTVIRLPEPGAPMQLLAGVVGLLAIGAWRARKAR